jgi:hypothetical protein
MTSAARDLSRIVFTLLVMAALANDWLGVREAYFGFCHWLGAQLSSGLVASIANARN